MTDIWERVKDTGVSAGEALKDGAIATGGALSGAAVITGEVLKDATISTGEVLKDTGIATGKVLKDAGDAVGRGATQAARGTAELYEWWLGEDTSKILTDCPVVKNILQHRESFEKDPEVFSRLYNVRMRPVLTAAVLAAGGIGSAAFDEALSRVTRHIFDGDQLVGGVLGDLIAARVGHTTVDAVNGFMDTVPGSGVMGGGWIHRIQHGHDIESLIEIGQEYGSEGVIQGLYHIFGRDFFTPAGIPILPIGGDQVHDFLMTHLNMTAEAAADLISLNSVEVAALIALFMSAKLAWNCFEDYRERAELQKLADRASQASDDGDLITASALFQEALAVRPQEGTISFALGMARYRMGNHLEAFLRFRDSASWLARTEPTVEIGGAAISLRGAAAGMALASIDAPARADRHGIDWIGQLEQLGMAGVTAFQKVAEDLTGTFLRPGRHLSAALNYYLAAKLVGGAMYLPQRDKLVERLHSKLEASLTVVEEKGQHIDELGFIRRFAAAELLPLATPT